MGKLEMTELERNNKTAMIAHGIDSGIMVLFILLQFAAKMVTGGYFLIVLLLGMLPVVAEYVFWRKNHDTEAIKHIVAIGYALFYSVVIFTTDQPLVFAFAIPMVMCVTVYNDAKYIILLNIGTVTESIILAVLGSRTGGYGFVNMDFAIVQIIIMLLVAFYSYFVTRTMNRNTRGKIAEVEESQRKTSELLENLSEISSKLKKGIEEINGGLEQFKETSDLTTESMKNLTVGAADTSQAVDKQSVQTKEIQEKLETTGETADSIMCNMERTLEVLEEGSKAVDILVKTTEQSVANGREVNDKLKALDTYMSEMNSIVSMIGSVAAQTTLLALNASIEAARAGEAGRGFAVVASEISKMADQTKSATTEIGNLIENVTRSITEVVEVITNMLTGITEEHESTENAAHSFNAIHENTIEISAGVKNLAENIEILKNANQEIVSVVETIAYNAEEVTAHAEDIMNSEENNTEVFDRLEDRMQKLMLLIKE